MNSKAAFRLDKKAVAGSFGRAAPHYDRHASLQRRVADRLLDALEGAGSFDSLLDLGSGTGYCSQILEKRFPDAELVNLDISAPMLQFARARHPGGAAHYVCGDAESLPFAGAAFDLLVSSLAIQWCASLEALFAELRRIARPGARCLLSTFGPETLRELREAWASVDSHVHVNDFPGLEEIAAGLEAQGLAGSRVAEEKLVLHYPDFQSLGAELKAIGARNRNGGQPRGLTGRGRLQRLRQNFEGGHVQGLGVPVTWQLFYIDFTVPK